MIDVASLKLKTAGKWFSIFESLGIIVRDDNKHSGCPICGNGNNAHRFRCDNKDNSGSWICTHCGAGDGTKLVQKVIGLNFGQAAERIMEVIGEGKTYMDALQTQKPKMDEVKVKEFLNKIWNESVPLTGSDPVSKYLHARKLVFQPDHTRYCPECWESDTKMHYPAMVCKIMNPVGVPVCIQRTYLDRDKPKKADIKSPRKMTPVVESLVGCAIRLFPIKTNELIVCEGIETAIACTQLFDISSWACMSNTILEGFMPPEGVRKIIICGDCDVHHVGQISAHKLAARLYKEDYIVDVRIPEILSTDWNDVL